MTQFDSLTNLTPAPASDPKSTSWLLIGGLLFIGLGLLYLVGATAFQSKNWWSIFILIPAIALLLTAGLAYQVSGGTFNLWVRLPLSGGLLVALVALIFVFNLNWGWAWTLMLIGPGLIIFINGFTTPSLAWGDAVGGFINLFFWLGAAVALLGLAFLLNQLNLISLTALFGNVHWWSVLILLPSVGALLNALAVYRANGPGAAVGYLLAIGLTLGFEAAAEFLNAPWQWRAPIALIIGGLAVLVGGWANGHE